MTPNIFRIATKELAQDGFFTWLLEWADTAQRQHDPSLHETAQDFVRLLLEKDAHYEVKQVHAWRQQEGIDIWAEVNGEYVIAIEDKTNSREHSKQLERYKAIVTNYCKGNKEPVLIYLKTGNECVSALQDVAKKGYHVIDREQVLAVLNKRPVANEILLEFTAYLAELESKTNAFDSFENVLADIRTAEGFYLRLQALLPYSTDWRYVANQSGGFLSFWYHWKYTGKLGLYIQIENAFKNGIKLVIRISDWDQQAATLYQVLSELEPYAAEYGLQLKKPAKYRVGATSCLAIVQNVFVVDDAGKLDLNRLINKLEAVARMLDAYRGKQALKEEAESCTT